MTTTLANSRKELSKQLGDYHDSASTSAGAAGGTTIVDTALMAKANDWVDTEMSAYDLITEAAHACLDEERIIAGLSNTAGTLTVLAHTAQIGSGVDYEIHRLFTASEKRRALVAAARLAYPAIYERVWDESLVSKNWLKDGSFEIWTTTTNLTYWTETTSTVTQISTGGLFKHGSYSARLTTLAGSLSQTVTDNTDLWKLAGESVTFTVQCKTNVANSIRISIYDGTTYTYSSYNDQITGWTGDSEPLTVTATIQDHPSAVTFTIHHDVVATAYVDDARVISDCVESPRLYIGNLGLAENRPVQVFVEPSDYYYGEPWDLIHSVDIDYEGGYLLLPSNVIADRRLRIRGIGYLDFLASGVSSTAWTATINIDKPQLDILIAQAALYLYTEMAMPNFTSGIRKDYIEMMGYWKAELRDRKNLFGMEMLSIPVSWGV